MTQVGDTAYLVRDLESDGQPIIGVYMDTEEDVILYEDADGVTRHAPYDCVRVEPFVVSQVPSEARIADAFTPPDPFSRR